jgi:dihydroflavonol-4-reductase
VAASPTPLYLGVEICCHGGKAMPHRSDPALRNVHSNTIAGGRPLRRVAVTGATGLLGGAVVAELLSHGVEVVAIVRNALRAHELLGEPGGLHLVAGDILDTDALEPALCGADAIIHTAAYFREHYRPGFDAALLDRTNVIAVGELIGAAANARVPVFVHISSAGTLRSTSPQHPADEDTPPGKASMRNHYYASKVRAQRLIESLRQDRSVHVPVVLPGWMWSPGDAGPTASGQMFLSVANGAMGAVPRVSAHIVDARDVAAACVRAAQLGHDRRYVVAGRRFQLPAVCAQIAQLCGAPAPRAVAPRMALAGSRVIQRADQLRHRPPLVTTRGTRVLLDMDRQWISSARAQAELGITFRTIDQTLRDEARWFGQKGIVPTDPVPTHSR